MKALLKKYREQILYLVFGGVTTAVSIGTFMLLNRVAGMPAGWANAIALAASITVAYVTNRRWVFESRSTGREAVREFALFIACRLGTALMDEGIVVLGIERLGPQGGIGEDAWAFLVKLTANVLVVIANYVFSKLMIFRKGK